MAGEVALVAEGITKRFGATLALDGVTVSFAPGEVHALMGENGAGKSTLGKTIAGLHRPDAGRVVLGGRALRPGDAGDAFRAGVRIVHQELAQCPNLSVAENICLHDLPRTRLGFVDRPAMRDRAAALVRPLDAGLDVEAPLGSLSPGRRQICQIASSLDDGRPGAGAPRVIIFDEPTSSLSVTEADRLLEIIRGLASRGLTLLYVSHRMGEVFSVCDRATVLRDGRFVATTPVAQLDEPALIEQMIGRRLEHAPTAPRASRGPAEPALRVRGLSSPRRLSGVSLDVAPGEVLGVGGLVGAGRSELLDAIFGLDAHATGEVRALGVSLPPGNPRAAVRAGLGYVPEDRRRQGLFFNLDLHENILLPRMEQFAIVGGVRRVANERRAVNATLREYRVKAKHPGQQPDALSGGNQQKLLLARWMGRGTRVLLLDEPTRGIDVGTKREVHTLVREAAAAGLAVLLVSSEMPELLALADRVVVMCEGRLTGELRGDELTQAGVLRLATLDRASPRVAPAT